MTPVPEWKLLIQKAWSVRLAMLSAALSALEVSLPMFVGVDPQGWLAAASAAVAVAAAVARVIAQPSLWQQ